MLVRLLGRDVAAAATDDDDQLTFVVDRIRGNRQLHGGERRRERPRELGKQRRVLRQLSPHLADVRPVVHPDAEDRRGCYHRYKHRVRIKMDPSPVGCSRSREPETFIARSEECTNVVVGGDDRSTSAVDDRAAGAAREAKRTKRDGFVP